MEQKTELQYLEESLRHCHMTFQRFEELLQGNNVKNFEEFLTLPSSKKRDLAEKFMKRYGFEDIVMSENEFSYRANHQRIIVHQGNLSEDELILGGLESIFIRLEEVIL